MSRHDVGRWALARGDAAYYGRYRRWAGMARALWGRLVENDEGERCEVCGRDYVLWHANGYLYRRVVGDGGGTFCPACFDHMAEERGIHLEWSPSRWIARAEEGSAS